MNNTWKGWALGFCVALLPMTATAQTESEQTGSKKTNLIGTVKKLAERTMVHGVDTNYIKTPKWPWRISLRSRVAQTDLKMHSVIPANDIYDGEFTPDLLGVGDLATDPRFITKVSTSLGVKVGYKGLSASYSFPIGGDKGQNLTLQGAGSWYSVNLRWRKFKTSVADTHFSGQMQERELLGYDPATEEATWSDWGEPQSLSESEKVNINSPITIKTLMFDGFYIFNRKRFSYAAAYNQKTIQVRSAGSPIAGLMGYYADFKYNNQLNADMIYLMNGVGRLRQYQLSIGAGYAYNFVPAKGWLISAMAMPMVTLVNRTRVNKYESNAKDVAYSHYMDGVVIDEEGNVSYDEEAANVDYSNEYVMTSKGVQSNNNRIALNFDVRLSITYNWDRYFINANGQFNNFHYRHGSTHGRLNDWYINASVGMRL